MATVPTLPNMPAGHLATSSDMNALAAVAQFFINGKPLAQTRASATQAFTANTLTVVNFGTKVYDNDGMFNSSFQGLTVQTNGWYRLSCYVPMAGQGDGSALVTTGTNNPAGSGHTSAVWPVNNGHVTSSQYSVQRAAGVIPVYLYALDQVQIEVSTASAVSTVSTDFWPTMTLEWVAS